MPGAYVGARKTDIEYIAALSEAHDSGLCVADGAARRRFSNDPLNLALAVPEVNRCGRGDKCVRDAAEWMPAMNGAGSPRALSWYAANTG